MLVLVVNCNFEGIRGVLYIEIGYINFSFQINVIFSVYKSRIVYNTEPFPPGVN